MRCLGVFRYADPAERFECVASQFQPLDSQRYLVLGVGSDCCIDLFKLNGESVQQQCDLLFKVAFAHARTNTLNMSMQNALHEVRPTAGVFEDTLSAFREGDVGRF